MKQAVDKCSDDLEEPALLIATNMRKSMACVTQVRCLSVHVVLCSRQITFGLSKYVKVISCL